MLNKRKTRELAMQLLFLWDSNGEPDTALAEQCLRDSGAESDVCRAAQVMATGAWEQRGMIEAWIERIAPQWPPRRQPGVDRNILRMSVWELTSAKTPPKVVIDEAIELAKVFSTEQSPAFINGVLDAVLKEIQGLKAEGTVGTEARRHEGTEGGQPESE
jgi:N utilization substance protein B